MADVPLALAIISTVSPVVAGAIPVIVGWIKDSGNDKRERAERAEAERTRIEQKKRRACVKLLRMVRDFRVVVENTCESRGSELAAHAEQIRQFAADINGQADEVGFMVFETEAAASSLAAEARRLVEVIADSKVKALGASIPSPDFTTFDRCLAEFRATAQTAFGYSAAPVVGSSDDVAGGERSELGLDEAPSVPGELLG